MLKSLQTRILLYSLLIASVPVLILGIISYESQRSLLEKEAKNALNAGSMSIVNEAYSYLNERISDVKLMSTNSVIINPDSSKEEKSVELKKFIDAKGNYYGVLHLDMEGNVIADTSNKMIGDNLAKRIWFKEAKEGHEFLSDVYKTQAYSEPIIALSAPVYDSTGKMTGVVSPAFRLEGLWEMMEKKANEISDKYPVDLFMINQDGTMISKKKPHGVIQDSALEEMGLTKEQLMEASLSDELYSAENGEKIHSIQPVHTIAQTENKWFVVVGADKKQVFQPLNDLLSRYLTIYSIVFVSIILAVYLLTKTLVRPVQDLVEATEDFIEGKEFVVSHKRSFEEMEKLNLAFLRMMETIEDREKEIVRTEKLKYVGQLAAGVAHEIRNPLTTIKGFFQLLKSQDHDKTLIEKYSDVMLHEVDRVNVFVTQLLDLAKPHQLEWEKIDLKDFLDEIIDTYTSSIPSSPVKLINGVTQSVFVYSDKNRLRQVLLNVLNNSSEAIEAKGQIELHLTAVSQYVKLMIRDDGKGISPENFKKIGMPFYTTKPDGNGLGVATCIQIMEELKGRFQIESVYDEGTKVTLIIPTTNRLIK
ncbi:signal transduction histidine kinase [Peribacillus simplex]|uniref:ATP-binding protein n=1 Tax=Peribacillus simplex TaxID=1478 RepID=UPI0024E1D853|nr:ATP-binding protein [Peribacillus simplex]MDF9761002.1 signal transduction histidine kinase [Peribacillus simplex]